MIKIVGVGDIMPGGLLHDSPLICADEHVLALLRDGDIRVGTLECALGDVPSYDEGKVADRGNVIYAKDRDINRLKELDINLVSLANNHFFDLGPDGALHSMALLDRAGILHCGAGKNLEEAGKPVVLEREGIRVAFLGFCDTDYDHVFGCTYATPDSPGVNPMEKDYVVENIKKCAAIYDHVVVLAHWGIEHTFVPTLSIYDVAECMLNAGASLILGSHPHRIQPVVNKRRRSVVYSMGNFLFPERLIAPPKVTWYPDGPMDYSSLPVTYEYPVVDCVMLKSLPFWARVGMIVSSCMDSSGVVSSYSFSYLNAANQITLLDKNGTRKAEWMVRSLSWIIADGLFRPFFWIRRAFRSVYFRVKRVFK